MNSNRRGIASERNELIARCINDGMDAEQIGCTLREHRLGVSKAYLASLISQYRTSAPAFREIKRQRIEEVNEAHARRMRFYRKRLWVNSIPYIRAMAAKR